MSKDMFLQRWGILNVKDQLKLFHLCYTDYCHGVLDEGVSYTEYPFVDSTLTVIEQMLNEGRISIEQYALATQSFHLASISRLADK